MFTKKRRETSLPIAVIDTETTGKYWTAHDRICEIGIVLLSPDGEILTTYETLVNPNRDLGPTHIHGIDAAECLTAPTFADIAGDILELLQGAGGIAGHNVVFDTRFLAAEYERLGTALGHQLKTLCTYRLTHASLSDACAQFDIKLQGTAHSALTDALATAELLRLLAGEAAVDLHEFITPLDLPTLSARHTPTVNRKTAKAVVEVRSGFLEELTDRVLYEFDASDDVAMDYLSLLRTILEDRVLDGNERELLHAFVADSKISVDQVRRLHVRYLEGMAAEAWADQVITDHELGDLRRVARLLDLDESAVDMAIEKAQLVPPDATSASYKGSEIVGSTVCFTGAIVSNLHGEIITRAMAKDLAEKAGLDVKNGVTKKLDMLVVADPNTASGKAKKAREYGTRIIAERDFWPMIGVVVS